MKENLSGLGEGDAHFLDDPEVRSALERMINEFAEETDRGAVLIAADIVSEHLRMVIESLAPAELGVKRTKEMLKYPGMLNTFAARADLAFMAGYISANAHKSIDLLRGIRNKAAHSQQAFVLKTHRASLEKMCDLGPGVFAATSNFARAALLDTMVQSLLKRGVELKEEIGSNPFATVGEIVDEISRHPDALAALEDRLPKTELAFGVWLLLGLIAHRKKSLLAARSANGT